ncbi:hypothetical protein [Paenibacillus tianjinensis]|uniref:Uncharacterized protein n=1 Tax=Paenibacillus tianjinensis TaxID=2810347 RepID=A0ABX7L6M6_9BACL|nr:hypothetical protein [Paenibacillus tianjinensis]QSF43401.1 hypothetical protein JRJ22_19235 [Paenibacillus tianjinensis]
MNITEYEQLKKSNSQQKIISIEDLKDDSDRTLLYGYTCSRNTWHVYIENKRIYVVVYGFDGDPKWLNVDNNYEFVPDKRLYPERCDYDFCRLLKDSGVELPFTVWTEDVENQKYYGKVIT